MKEEELYCCTLIVCLVVIVIGLVGGCHIVNVTDRKAIENGYSEVPNGGNGNHWAKP